MRRISSSPGAWSSSRTIRPATGARPSNSGAPVSLWLGGAGGEQAALAGAQHDPRLVGAGPVADAGDELAGAGQHRGEGADRLGRDVAPLVGCKFDVLERNPLERAVGAPARDGGDVEEGRLGQQGVVGQGDSVLSCVGEVATPPAAD